MRWNHSAQFTVLEVSSGLAVYSGSFLNFAHAIYEI